jgi:hypothetical protein
LSFGGANGFEEHLKRQQPLMITSIKMEKVLDVNVILQLQWDCLDVMGRSKEEATKCDVRM